MKIEILGTGCSKCKALEEATKQAVAQSGKFAQIEKVRCRSRAQVLCRGKVQLGTELYCIFQNRHFR